VSDCPRIGIVIPTLGIRREYLIETIKSVRSFGHVFIMVVIPFEKRECVDSILGIDQVAYEIQSGLGTAINLGIELMPDHIEYVGWIGDDDLLSQRAGFTSIKFLDENPNYVMTFGICNYINQTGKIIGVNKSGQWAVPLLCFGPDLIPQPGSIFRRSIFNHVGKIDTRFTLAFDFELFIRLAKTGEVKYLGVEVGSFRWHGDSKTVKTRGTSVIEASRVRRMHLPRYLLGISWAWEIPVLIATYLAGLALTLKVNRSLKS
jgi:glycosyltransferase involved in cell wall biosynthesis